MLCLSTAVPHSRKTDSSRRALRSSGEAQKNGEGGGGGGEESSEQSQSSHTKREGLTIKIAESDSNSNSNQPISDDSTSQGTTSPPIPRKTVAIDMSQNECFTHRLLPAVSPEFDNVMDQVCTCSLIPWLSSAACTMKLQSYF